MTLKAFFETFSTTTSRVDNFIELLKNKVGINNNKFNLLGDEQRVKIYNKETSELELLILNKDTVSYYSLKSSPDVLDQLTDNDIVSFAKDKYVIDISKEYISKNLITSKNKM